MTIKEVIEFYGSLSVMASRCEIKPGTAYAWKCRGFIPYLAQHKIQACTKGKLKANLEDARKCL